MPHDLPDFATFKTLASAAPGGANLVPMFRRLMGDQLTAVLAYRRLVRPDDRLAPSFLLESVVGGERIGRYSYLGAQPMAQIIARGHQVQYLDARDPRKSRQFHSDDPLREMDRITSAWKLAQVPGLPDFTGGWVGLAGYDTVRYLEGEKLATPPRDDRGLPDLHMGLYHQVVAFDHVQKTVLAITHVLIAEYGSIDQAYAAGQRQLDELVARIETPAPALGRVRPLRPDLPAPELPVGDVDLDSPPPQLPPSNMGLGGYQNAVLECRKFIAAGDVFQVVPSQRFELRTAADPFDVYRALRVINPSPYMFYVQIDGAILVGSSPEILCRVHDGVVTNRPLAGTRRRGSGSAEDLALERELLADPKDRAEHIMLVDLGRNDVGRVAQPGTIATPQIMAVERYSHVMHISSTVTGTLRAGCTCWDALRTALPVGTVSGAPKVRAMQIIDSLEPTRRGPYAGAVGYADFQGNMDMAIALRTMVILPAGADTPAATTTRPSPQPSPQGRGGQTPWIVHIQVGAGIVADSQPDAEHQETVNKAAALAKAVAMAESAFTSSPNEPRP
jgi:anthranilate synthase component 1